MKAKYASAIKVELVIIRECETQKQMKQDKDFNNYINQHKQVWRERLKLPSIDYRKHFYGGRTETFKLYDKCNEDEEIVYYDVNGLYPHVLATKFYSPSVSF